MAFRTAVSLSRDFWGNFGPEMEALTRNGSGAKENVLSIIVSSDSGFS